MRCPLSSNAVRGREPGHSESADFLERRAAYRETHKRERVDRRVTDRVRKTEPLSMRRPIPRQPCSPRRSPCAIPAKRRCYRGFRWISLAAKSSVWSGQSGSGKSTLAAGHPRCWAPTRLVEARLSFRHGICSPCVNANCAASRRALSLVLQSPLAHSSSARNRHPTAGGLARPQ